jgi:hypothetical protein
MSYSIYDKVIAALKQAESHNSNLMTKPEVILWPDPELLWVDVIPTLQESRDNLFIYGSYEPQKNQGPSIWLKCMMAKSIPEAIWKSKTTPIIYLPGVSKNELKNVEEIGFQLQPLVEYQYTGTTFAQENGKEWTVMAFVENPINGLGLKVNKDNATKEALRKALPTLFQDKDIFIGKSFIDADFLNNQLFPNIIPSILKWICKGDAFLDTLDAGKKEVFANICKAQYDFEPDHRNIKAIVEKLGTQKNGWNNIWQFFAAAPNKYPEVEDVLRLAKPDDLGIGLYAIPQESWPQVNEEKGEALRVQLEKLLKLDPKKASIELNRLEEEYKEQRNWIWYELDKAPLLKALAGLKGMANNATAPFPSATIEEITAYYISEGYKIDFEMRQAYAAVKTEKDKTLIKEIIQLIYKPWLENTNNKFQALVQKDASIFTSQKAAKETESYVLFVDAFRYELAVEFCSRLTKLNYKIKLENSWSAIPSLTPTAKPNVAPIATLVATNSHITEFRPQLETGKDLQTNEFRKALKAANFNHVVKASDINPAENSWEEIGDIDTKGHQEQADMVKSIEELFEQVQESLDNAFEKGVKKIKIVTDHGWLLLPGGLPKTELNSGLAETRWGRCALIKEGANTDLLHLPWRWNESVFIAYAPGISFFKINEEYAHGGISIQECLVPTIYIENPNSTAVNSKIKNIKWVNLKCNITTESAKDNYSIDIRRKFNDGSTSIVEKIIKNNDKKIVDNKIFVMAKDSAEAEAATIVLLDENGRILDKKATTVGE